MDVPKTFDYALLTRTELEDRLRLYELDDAFVVPVAQLIFPKLAEKPLTPDELTDLINEAVNCLIAQYLAQRVKEGRAELFYTEEGEFAFGSPS